MRLTLSHQHKLVYTRAHTHTHPPINHKVSTAHMSHMAIANVSFTSSVVIMYMRPKPMVKYTYT